MVTVVDIVSRHGLKIEPIILRNQPDKITYIS